MSTMNQGFQVNCTWQQSQSHRLFNQFVLFFLTYSIPRSPLKFNYTEISVVQMRFLRLNSRLVTQNITFSCHHMSKQGKSEREIKFLADSRRQSFLGTLRDCVVRFFQIIIHFWPCSYLVISCVGVISGKCAQDTFNADSDMIYYWSNKRVNKSKHLLIVVMHVVHSLSE